MDNKKLHYLLNLVKNCEDIVFIVDENFSILYFNDKVKKILPKLKNIYYKNFFELIKFDEDVKTKFYKSIKEEKIEDFEIDLKTDDKNIKTNIELTPFLFDNEKLLVIKIVDKEKECISKITRKNFNLIQKIANIGIWEYDIKNGKIIWSDELYNILGFKKEEISPKPLIDMDIIDKKSLEFVSKIFFSSIEDKKGYKIAYKIVRPDKSERYIDERVIYVKDKDNEYLIGVDIDITKKEHYQKKLLKQAQLIEHMRKKAEEAKKEAIEANRARSIFLSNISHEIRTLLNAVLGYAQILKQDKDLNEKQKRMVQSILISGGYLLDLINDILDIIKMEMGKNKVNLVEFNLTEMLKSLYKIFKIRADSKHLEWIIVGMPKENLLVKTDKTKLFHILLNLIGNAIKFTEEGKVELIFKLNKNSCYFEIKDTGIGIDEDMKNKIFEPFIQNEEGYKRGGTGLGLSIANSYVKLLGGELNLESKLGKGTKFYFEIPCENIKKIDLIQDNRFDNGWVLKKGAKLRVLIADDIKDNLIVLKNILKQKGINVEIAKDGEEVIKKCKTFNPDIIFMDIKMPKKDGIDATKEIKMFNNSVKIVSLSASSIFYSKENLKIFDDDISKPFSISDLDRIFLKYFPEKFEKEENDKKISKKIAKKMNEDIRKKIIEYAKIGQINELKKIIEDLEDDEIKKVLLKYLRNFDLEKIVEKLEDKEKNE